MSYNTRHPWFNKGSAAAPLDIELLNQITQEIYVIRNDGTKVYVPFETYRSAPTIEWWNSDQDYHLCFLTPNGWPPINLSGPIVTKVIPWNINSAQLPKELADLPLEPGYLIDLRGLQIARLNFGFLNCRNIEVVLPQTKQAIEGDANIRPYDGNVPDFAKPQLLELPPENLYILSWREPLSDHSKDRFESYQLNYLSGEQLAKCLSADEVDKDNFGLKQGLEDYYEKAGVQSGRLNPLDFIEPIQAESFLLNPVEFSFITCYVANLKSFDHK